VTAANASRWDGIDVAWWDGLVLHRDPMCHPAGVTDVAVLWFDRPLVLRPKRQAVWIDDARWCDCPKPALSNWWRRRAMCLDMPEFFDWPWEKAKELCLICPVAGPCLEFSMNGASRLDEDAGVAGGLDPQGRHRIRLYDVAERGRRRDPWFGSTWDWRLSDG
jgi:hypothetical protein